MSGTHTNTFPKLNNAAWPGVVGKGEEPEPAIALDTMLDLIAAAEVDGVKFVTAPRGRMRVVHRVEYPDGSGDVIFKAGGPTQSEDDYWGPPGFPGVTDIRRVEEQLRMTLVLSSSDLSGPGDRTNRERPHGTGGSV